VRQSCAAYRLKELLHPDFLTADRNLEMISPNGRPFSECTSDDLHEFLDWFRAIMNAARALKAAYFLTAATMDFKI
jgi:hypothetical protein